MWASLDSSPASSGVGSQQTCSCWARWCKGLGHSHQTLLAQSLCHILLVLQLNQGQAYKLLSSDFYIPCTATWCVSPCATCTRLCECFIWKLWSGIQYQWHCLIRSSSERKKMFSTALQIQCIILVHVSCWVLAWSQSWHILTRHGSQTQFTQDHEYLVCIIARLLGNDISNEIVSWPFCHTLAHYAVWTWNPNQFYSMINFLIVLLEAWELRLTRGLLAVVMIPGIMINLETCSDCRQTRFKGAV